MSERYADLHLHTVYSDGFSTPAQVVARARNLGFAAISIVDHDTVKGIPSTLEECRAAGVELVPGLELSTYDGGGSVHILGYGIEWRHEDLQSFLEDMERRRRERMAEIFRKLASLGVVLEPQEFLAVNRQGTVGRLQLAHFLVRKGVVGGVAEAFERYIGDGKPAYLPVDKLTPREGVELIRRYGGVAVLAHPGITRRDELIPRLVSWGLQGIEVYYSKHSPEVMRHYENVARKHGLLILGGSDCHGADQGELLIGSVRLPYSYVEQLKVTLREGPAHGHH